MKINELMSTDVVTCPSNATVADAARIMWRKDCGFVPVTDVESGALVGVVTDRDACMAGWSQNRPFSEIPVASCMSREVHLCRPDQEVEIAEALLRKESIRRLPVVDHEGRIVGVLSLNDLVLAVRGSKGSEARGLGKEVLATLGAVSSHRGGEPAVETAAPLAASAEA